MTGPLSTLARTMHRPFYASRLKALVAAIMPHLEEGDRVVDVGCGSGTLGRALMDDPRCPRGVQVEGLERMVRGGEPIKVHAYPGGRIPFDDGAFDVVIVADVLHHEQDPETLMRECARISKRLLMIKDHQVKGLMAQSRLSFMDWAANAPYGVPCLYRYNSEIEWKQVPGKLGLEVVESRGSMKLYPPVVNSLFGGELQFFGVLKKR